MNPYPYVSGAFSEQEFATIMDTVDNTPVVALSIPVPEEKVFYGKVLVMCFDISDFNPAAIVEGDLVGFRRVGGSVQKPQNFKLTPVVSNFSAPQPSMDAVVNGNNIDLQITGKSGVNLRWHIKVRSTTTA